MAFDRYEQQGTIRKFKGETVFDWDNEPSDERPTTFAESTQYGQLWGPSRSPYTGLEQQRPRPPRKKGGIGTAWLAVILVVVMAGAAIVVAARYLDLRSTALFASVSGR